jgi:hypothetical protein
MAGSMVGKVVPAPGAMTAPHMPGMTPDRTTVPTHVGEAVPAAGVKVRPLSQYGTAEELARVFKRKPMDELEPADFEQAPASLEEMRKAIPANLTPMRPLPAPGSTDAIEAGGNPAALTAGEF